MLTLNEAIDAHALALRAEGKSLSTVRWYGHVLRLLPEHLLHAPVGSIDAGDLRHYMASLWYRDVARNTVRSYHTGLAAFWSWASVEYGINNPMRNISKPRASAKEPRGVDAQDFRRLFDATLDTVHGTRDRFLLALIADTGIRRGGVESLLLDSLDVDQGRAFVTEKLSKTRWVYFTHAVQRLGAAWLRERPGCASPYVFVSLRAGHQPKKLTGSGIYQIFRRCRARAGVTGRCNPHAFRHSFARRYLLSGGDAVTLAKLCGWSDVNTAKQYAVFSHDELQSLHAAHSPLLQMLNE